MRRVIDMRPDQRAALAAALAVAGMILVACWGLVVRPEAWRRWCFVALLVPGLWAFLEVARFRGSRSLAR
jgi:hypothetical protein